MGMNITNIEMNILNGSPEYHIKREIDAKTAFSSLEITLTHASSGETMNVKHAKTLSLFAAFTVLFTPDSPVSSVFQTGTSRRIPLRILLLNMSLAQDHWDQDACC